MQQFFSFLSSISFESPGNRKPLVESVSGWRKQAQGERDAGLVPEQKIVIDFYRCDLCGCSIGPGYDQQTMYLYPVRQESCYSWKVDKLKYYESAWLHICGSCAHVRYRSLPRFLEVLRPEYWTTTMLLCPEGVAPQRTNMSDPVLMTKIRAAITEVIAAYARYLFTVLLVHYCPSYRVPFRVTQKKEVVSPQRRYRKVVLQPLTIYADELADLFNRIPTIEELSPIIDNRKQTFFITHAEELADLFNHLPIIEELSPILDIRREERSTSIA